MIKTGHPLPHLELPIVGGGRRVLGDVVLPAPLWPVTKQNSPFAMWKETSLRAAPVFGYSFVTLTRKQDRLGQDG